MDENTDGVTTANALDSVMADGGGGGVQTQTTIEQSGGDARAQSSKAATCGVCNTEPPKYKCPRCYMPYCSVACNKIHRENHPPDPEPASTPKPEQRQQQTPKAAAEQSTPPDPNNPFRALDSSSDKLQMLFAKYPELPQQLLDIHAATQPPTESNAETKGIPASLLKGIPKKDNWNHDIGIKNGKEALRKARRDQGERGEAIREYCELITHLMNDGAAGSHATGLLQQQAAAQDTQLIESLLAKEKR